MEAFILANKCVSTATGMVLKRTGQPTGWDVDYIFERNDCDDVSVASLSMVDRIDLKEMPGKQRKRKHLVSKRSERSVCRYQRGEKTEPITKTSFNEATICHSYHFLLKCLMEWHSLRYYEPFNPLLSVVNGKH